MHPLLAATPLTGPAYWLAPQRIIHSWVEVSLDGRWHRQCSPGNMQA